MDSSIDILQSSYVGFGKMISIVEFLLLSHLPTLKYKVCLKLSCACAQVCGEGVHVRMCAMSTINLSEPEFYI